MYAQLHSFCLPSSPINNELEEIRESMLRTLNVSIFILLNIQKKSISHTHLTSLISAIRLNLIDLFSDFFDQNAVVEQEKEVKNRQ